MRTRDWSVAWWGVGPRGDEAEPNAAGLAFYDRVINELLAHNIVPLVTLSHYELPLYLAQEYGGGAGAGSPPNAGDDDGNKEQGNPQRYAHSLSPLDPPTLL